MSVVVAAIRKQLKIETAFRSMFGVDLASRPGPVLTEDQILMKAKIEVAQQYLTQHTALPALVPLPPGYASMSPEDQAAADLQRRRNQLAALPAPRLEVDQGEILEDN